MCQKHPKIVLTHRRMSPHDRNPPPSSNIAGVARSSWVCSKSLRCFPPGHGSRHGLLGSLRVRSQKPYLLNRLVGKSWIKTAESRFETFKHLKIGLRSRIKCWFVKFDTLQFRICAVWYGSNMCKHSRNLGGEYVPSCIDTCPSSISTISTCYSLGNKRIHFFVEKNGYVSCCEHRLW